MNDFQFSDLNSFFELMAALNLAPSLFNPLIESYVHIFSNAIRKNKARLRENLETRVYGIQDDLLAKANEAIDALPMDDERKKKEITEEIKRDQDVVKAKMAIVLENVVVAFNNYLRQKQPEFKKRITDNVPRLRTSFLAAGIFCIVMLVLHPLSKMFLGGLGLELTYFHFGFLCFLFAGFQILYLMKAIVPLTDINVAVIVGVAMVLMIAACYFSSLLLPILPYSCGLFKSVVVLTMITACLSYLMYAAKFRVLVLCQMRIIEKHHDKVLYDTIKEHLQSDLEEEQTNFKNRILDWFIDKYDLEGDAPQPTA
jgi:hypothetical protein